MTTNNETIFRKVSVTERLPIEEKYYHTDVGNCKFELFKGSSLKQGWKYGACPTYWLEEIQPSEQPQESGDAERFLEKKEIWSSGQAGDFGNISGNRTGNISIEHAKQYARMKVEEKTKKLKDELKRLKNTDGVLTDEDIDKIFPYPNDFLGQEERGEIIGKRAVAKLVRDLLAPRINGAEKDAKEFAEWVCDRWTPFEKHLDGSFSWIRHLQEKTMTTYELYALFLEERAQKYPERDGTRTA